MHELIRNNNKFRIAKHRRNEFVVTPQLSTGILPIESERELDKEVWRQFVNNEKTDQDYIKASVTDSWVRCLQMGVDPGLEKCVDFREEKSLDDEHRFLREVVRSTAGELSAFLKEKELLFTISDRYGYLTGPIGSCKTLVSADSINFGP